MRAVLAAVLVTTASLLPGRASAAEIEKHDLKSGKTYVSYHARGVPEQNLRFLVLVLSSKEKTGEAAAAAWKERFGSIPVIAVFPEQSEKGWAAYDWETRKIIKDREIDYLHECVADAESEWDIVKGHTLVAGDGNGGDYAFELALRSPERFAGAVSMVPSWCAHNKYEANAKQVRLYLLVGEKDDRKKQAQDAYDRLLKHGGDMIWRPVAGLGHELPPLEEVARAFRWQRELALPPSEESLAWAIKEFESGATPVGVHLLGKLAKDKTVGARARKLRDAIEKQARKELEDARKQPKYAQIDELWRLKDRWSCLREVYDGVRKSLADCGATEPVPEKPPPPEPDPDEEAQRILAVAERARAEKRQGDHAKAIASLEEMLSLIDKAQLGANEKKTLTIAARYELARCYALSGKKASAIEELTKAVDLGYSDWKQIEADKELETLRDDAGFRSLLARRK